ncbi:MAG: lipid-binding SYLF domain-containing protein [Halieaceae bacterium]|nr:lipid-binding SYLF domain-containing protein [Halieaceae bacterium]MCP5165019.1 lipid-binding SYLF domain-containing protein [Pseudomonadales bacterium]MCP5202662.1 lipid-binding SYLF domain-containing protein [Pseudomonadales bacterium]
MQRILKAGLLLPLLSLLLAAASPARADEYSDTIKSFMGAGLSGQYFDGAYGYAVFPTIGKVGFIVGGAYGEGRVYAAGQYVGNSSMMQLAAGWLAGAQAYSQIIFFQNQTAYEEFTSGNFEFSAQATAVAITAGVNAEASTTGGLAATASGGRNDAATAQGGYRRGLAVFTIAKGGLMFEVSLGGQKYSYTPL